MPVCAVITSSKLFVQWLNVQHGGVPPSEKGVRMFGFPADSERRRRWLIEVSRLNWITGDANNKKLCEAHFEADQFERSKEKTRLKADAIPSIFSHCSKVKKRRALTPRDNCAPVNLAQINTEHNYTAKAHTVTSQIKSARAEESERKESEDEERKTNPTKEREEIDISSKEREEKEDNLSNVYEQREEIPARISR
ncbi:hypothetical protein UPYG_G00116480 [Umbra pygmaea]|uniref:THAP domain-containing protein 1 n=1 Tax=Umbra pygmaea TaxID=75934 RepID=A0ABD0X7Z4_UMBPY